MTELKRIRLRHSESYLDAVLFEEPTSGGRPIYFVRLERGEAEGVRKCFITLNFYFVKNMAEAYLNKVANAIEIWEEPDVEREEEETSERTE